MRKYYCCLCLLVQLLAGNEVFSQNDFRPGCILTSHLDTVYGLINNRSNSINSMRCEFKTEEKAEVKIYLPLDINSYILSDNRHYVSRTINFKGAEKPVFLEFLVDGIIDLYYYNEGFEEYYYVEKEGEIYQLDNNRVEVVDEYGGEHFRYSNQYKGVLKKLLGDVPEFDWTIINSKFELASLINLTKEYHRIVCTDEICIDYSKKKKWDIFCEAILGADFSFMGLGSSHDYAKDLQPLVGVNLRFKDNRYNNKLNLLTGVNLSKHAYSGGFRHTLVYSQRTMSHGVDLNCTLLRIPITLEYVPLTGKFKPSLSVTYNNSFLLNPEYKVEIRSYGASDGYTSIPTESPLRRYEYGFMLGLGFCYEIDSNSYLTAALNGEYRVPNSNFNLILDRLFFKSVLFHVGYGFRIH